ncbi:anti-sigma factor [Haloechinothrix sp. YIM 98757]|uniref:Anti-sigma factor n=1 Tax=Haloechinothrix aidingensis TaxID=2752311 RepID=A0A838ACN1_9PSEU|nr:anti-sigma factor [Haloechinothrix aidingensis]MBA0127029.1 anti-sigma factor [Haloechinothrix aidingensis]
MSATVMMSDDKGKLAFVSHRMLVPASEHAYQLWLITPHGRHSAGMSLRPTSSVVADSVAGVRHVGLTAEPEGGSQQPTTGPIELLALT